MRKLLIVLVCATVLGFSAAPASAHDSLVASTPADGAVLDTAPGSVALTFSAPPADIDPEVVVARASGEAVTVGPAVVTGPTVTVALPEMLVNDTYTVTWRLVSADGHPGTGTLTFTVAIPAQSSVAPAPAESSVEPTDAQVPSAPVAVTPVTTAVDDADSANRSVLTVVGIVLAACVGAVISVVLVRRRRHSELPPAGDA